ncbi:pantoate-beta-alanine ligase-like protein, partial [Trifolium pratense]
RKFLSRASTHAPIHINPPIKDPGSRVLVAVNRTLECAPHKVSGSNPPGATSYVRDLDFSIKVIGCEITRENDGLAMSSRNVHLSPEEREKALSINKSLSKAKSAVEDGQVQCEKLRNLVIQCITEAGGTIDYAEVRR